MDFEIFEKMDAPELRKYIQFLLWHYRVVDAFWYLYITEQFDEATADQLNERVWGKVTAMAAKDLLKRFDIQQKGLEGFVSALRFFPWCILVGYEIEQKPERGDYHRPFLPDPGGQNQKGPERICLQRNAPGRVCQLRPGNRPAHSDRLFVCATGSPSG